MVDNFKEININDIKDTEDIDKVLQEKIGLSLADCAQALSTSLTSRASEVVVDMINLAPYGKYDQLTEDKEVMAKFLIEEASKPEHWKLQYLNYKKDGKLMEMVFFNSSVDDGDILKGFVFVGVSGKIRHSFCQAQ